ncbi:MAG: hypothetical protein ACKOCW_15360 [Planctomycetaceae bacterium]
MDAHFREYMGAVAAMQELYGEPACDRSDFHLSVTGVADHGAACVADHGAACVADHGTACVADHGAACVDHGADAAAPAVVEPMIVAEVRDAVASPDAAAFAKAV